MSWTLEFAGGAGTVTGSCFVLRDGGSGRRDGRRSTTVLVDCGMYQGGEDLEALNDAPFAFDPVEVSAVILTHAHIDHSGLVPRLFTSGYRGPVYATPGTVDLCAIMLPDSGHIQELDAGWRERKAKRAGVAAKGPLYTAQDSAASLTLFRPVDYDQTFGPAPGVRASLRNAGHIFGSAVVEMWLGEPTVKVVFSGDLGNIGQPIVRDPDYIRDADVLVLESTYGDRVHEDRPVKVKRLKEIILSTIASGGNVVIPAFAVARTQDLLFEIADLMNRGELPRPLPVYIDSPLATSATEVFAAHPDYYDVETRRLIESGLDPFQFDGLSFCRSVEESRALNDVRGAVIVAASGMCDFGRIRHHLKHNLWRPESTILFVGYQASGTLGRRILDGEKKVRILNEEIAVKARVESIDAFSAHADREGLIHWVRSFVVLPQHVCLVHGEPEAVSSLGAALGSELGVDWHAPRRGEVLDLSERRVLREGEPQPQQPSAVGATAATGMG